MYIEIHANTEDALNETDKQILLALAGSTGTSAPKTATAPAKKTAAPATKKTEPEPVATEEEETSNDDPTMADLKALATRMVAAGDAAKVKEALGTVGAKKISDVSEDDVAKVYAALS